MKSRSYTMAHMLALRTGVAILAGVGVFLGTQSASAAEGDDGPTQLGEICMQKVFGAPVTNANKLNCTANDIRLARAIKVSQASCIKGTTFDLTATFEVRVTANARYDAGFFFRVDGGPSARGDGNMAVGECSLSVLDPPVSPTDAALNLDGDSCGDFNSGTYEVTFTIPDVECTAAANSEFLSLPNCTSWHSNASTACQSVGLFDTEGEALQLHPDTKSKCACDDTFTVPITVEPATITVTKDAAPTHVPEPGGEVTYTVTVKNNATVESVTITSIHDTIPGPLVINLGTNEPAQTDNTCPTLIGTVLAPGKEATCSFKADVAGDEGARITDTVNVCSKQDGLAQSICDDDTADVDITNVYTAPTLTKTALSTADCQMKATYQVVVNNHSAMDTLTVDSLTDNKFGDITHVSSQVLATWCSLPVAPIAPLGNFTCEFVGLIQSASCDIEHTNVVTASVEDDEGQKASPSDDATVTLKATP